MIENPLSVSLDDAQDPTDISRDKAIVDPASSYAHLKALLTGGIEVCGPHLLYSIVVRMKRQVIAMVCSAWLHN